MLTEAVKSFIVSDIQSLAERRRAPRCRLKYRKMTDISLPFADQAKSHLLCTIGAVGAAFVVPVVLIERKRRHLEDEALKLNAACRMAAE